MQDAGASALELNIYFVPTDPAQTGQQLEQQYLDLVGEVKASVTIPVAAKVGPYFSAMANMGRRLAEAGADGLVIFNRYLMPDIDLDNLEVVPKLELSTPSELRLPLRWIAILRDNVDASLALTSGVHTPADALKAILVGADVVMPASALLKNGPSYLGALIDGVRDWLDEREYTSVAQAKGSMSRSAAPAPEAFERSNYMQALVSYTTGSAV
jgi:dihydroorotate dehydrogenase (fumarate)